MVVCSTLYRVVAGSYYSDLLVIYWLAAAEVPCLCICYNLLTNACCLSWEKQIKQTGACLCGVFALIIFDSATVPPSTTGEGVLRLTSTLACQIQIF